MRAIFYEYTDLVEPLSLDEAYLDVTQNKKGLTSASKMARLIREEIKKRTGLNASAGIAPNKFVAKIASDVKTIQGTLERALRFIFKNDDFKTLAAGRTDAMVSANQAYCHLTTKMFYEVDELLENLNKNLPQDIRVLTISEVGADFDILQKNKQKEYHYLFSHGERNHPFCAALITGKHQTLDIGLMQQGAKLFEGTHHFKKYTVRAKENTQFTREVFTSEIIENSIYQANFFPKQSFIYRVVGPGFMRYQIRMMMGQLFLLGAHKISLEDIQNSLTNVEEKEPLTEIAPASGLILHKSEFE